MIVEADGGAHQDPAYDAARDQWFEGEGFKVVRVRNDDVIGRPDFVIGVILEASGRGDPCIVRLNSTLANGP